MQKSKVLVCDRPFKCPVCRRDFVVGDEIILLLPQRTRYCSPCGTTAIKRINEKHTEPVIETGFSGKGSIGSIEDHLNNQVIDTIATISKRLDALEAKPESLPADDVRYVDLKTYSDRQISIWRELETLNQKLTRLETRLDSIE